jgi:GT2 family glycosyltransferase
MAFSSLSLSTLLRALDASGLASQFGILIYDNSPFKSAMPDRITIPFHFVHDPANGGLFRAYTAALQLAQKERIEWLLLLDQDTALDAAFVRTLWFNLPQATKNIHCAALVPKLLCKNEIISPVRVLWGGRLLPVKKELVGFPPYELMALNSGTALRISAIRAVGGFKPEFWLDYLDHWLYNRLHRANFLVYVLDTMLPHELSVKNMSNMSVQRYKNILKAEGEFYSCCKSHAENLSYGLKLIIRVFKMLAIPGRHKFLLPVIEHLLMQIRRKKSSTTARQMH